MNNSISPQKATRFWWLCTILLLVLSSACNLIDRQAASNPNIETMIEQAVKADCKRGACEHLTIDSTVVNYSEHYYYLVRVSLPFEALADVISVRLVECDDQYSTCTVVDKYEGEFGVVKIVTDTGHPHLQWEPFNP